MQFRTSRFIKLREDALDADSFSSVLLELGFDGSWTESDTSVHGYAESRECLDIELPDGWGLVETTLQSEELWTQQCKDLLASVTLGKLTIQPIQGAHALPANKTPDTLYLIPGMGFGTGHHPTTATLTTFFQDDHIQSSPPKKCLDVGTGSGVLAIALALLYGSHIDACDIDAAALDNARENAELNDVSDKITFSTQEIDAYQGEYDLIVANIYAEVLVEIQAALKQRLKINHPLFLSGIMESKRELILASFAKPEWELHTEKTVAGESNGWTSMHFVRRV